MPNLANNVPFNEHGMSMVQRSLEDLYLRVEGGTNDLNAGALDVSQAAEEEDEGSDEVDLSGYLQAAQNLADLTSAPTARDNLGIGMSGFSASAAGPITVTTGIGAITTITGLSTASAPDFSTVGAAFNGSVFTVPVTGYWHIGFSGSILCGALFSTARVTLISSSIGFYFNGAFTLAGQSQLEAWEDTGFGRRVLLQNKFAPLAFQRYMSLTAGDTISIAAGAFVDSPVPTSSVAALYAANFSARLIVA